VFPENDHGAVTIEFNEQAQRVVNAMHRTVAALAAGGDDVIVDHVLLEDAWKDDLLSALEPYDVAIVGVQCSPDALREREAARGDRVAGQAEGQVERVHAGVAYDLEIDVTELKAREAAAELVRWLVEQRGWTAADA
jgi:chloramphenicol 3-O phosphotransferase